MCSSVPLPHLTLLECPDYLTFQSHVWKSEILIWWKYIYCHLEVETTVFMMSVFSSSSSSVMDFMQWPKIENICRHNATMIYFWWQIRYAFWPLTRGFNHEQERYLCFTIEIFNFLNCFSLTVEKLLQNLVEIVAKPLWIMASTKSACCCQIISCNK